MTETSEQIKKEPMPLGKAIEWLQAMHADRKDKGVEDRYSGQVALTLGIEALDRLNKPLPSEATGDEQIKKARREAVYAVETLLEDEGIALYYTRYKGDEQLPGEQVSLDIIRRVLEREDE